jgi:hypothetical protein
MINEMVYKVEAIRMAITTSSQYLGQGDQDTAELFFDKFSTELYKMQRELEEFYELSEFVTEQNKLKV